MSTQGDGMADVTDADREKAASLLAVWHGGNFGQGVTALEPLIAFALAEEREKARVPFLALADEFDAEATGASVRSETMARTDENVRHHTAERRQARVAAHHAALIRWAAGVSV